MGGADFLSDDGDRVSKGDLVIIPIRLLNRSYRSMGRRRERIQVRASVALHHVVCFDGRSIVGRSDGMIFPMR
jgi:single-stranded DNA-binding protein